MTPSPGSAIVGVAPTPDLLESRLNGHDGRTDPAPEDAPVADRGRRASDAVAEADRRAAAADQAASDSDQAVADHEDAAALRDQRSADRDQESATDRPGSSGESARREAYEVTRAARAASRIDRLSAHAARTGAADLRLAAARQRDRSGSQRDDAERHHDVRALGSDGNPASTGGHLREQFEHLWVLAATSRAAAARRRARGAAERAEAVADRVHLADTLRTAYLDNVTGTFRPELGRRALDLELDRAGRREGQVVLALVEVDDLAGVVDRAGRATGDGVLRALVAAMRANLRAFDPIVRLDGARLMCAMRGMNLEDAGVRIGRIRASLYADTGIGITVGLVAILGGETLEQLAARAEVAHAAAKVARQP